MDIHYNAFISYRHHPDDIKVAANIHRSLERFRVPKSLRKSTKGITRLFRDKEELPITSNLTDDISSALRNSDYLIVICSVHTKESVWVQREIELFLSTHPRNRVLTVLASGEPYDVIPDILLSEEVTDPVTGETRIVPIEPLSCDWRMKRRKAMREELPRLAAALLGCGYDVLRQRQKQYRARRAMAIVSAALVASLCLMTYFLYTSITIQKKNVQIQAANEEIRAANVKIQANLEQALRNQSRHLATAALERLQSGDRLTAISLAMAALPGSGGDRPYVPEAEYVLGQALGVYGVTPRLSASGAVSPGMNVAIKEFYITDNQSILYLRDQRNLVTAWDTAALEQLGQIDLTGMYFKSLFPMADGSALIHSGENGNVLQCFRPDGTCLWTVESCLDVAYTETKDTVLAIISTGLLDNTLAFLDPLTGEAVREPIDLGVFGISKTPSAFYVERCAADGPIAIRYSTFTSSEILLFNTDDGSYQTLSTPATFPRVATTAGNKLLVLGSDESSGFMGSFGDSRVNSPVTNRIYCYDLTGGALLWESEITACSFTGDLTLSPIPGSERVLCQSGPVFQVMDVNTGAVLARCEAGSSAISVSVGETSATAILQDGYLCRYNYDFNYCNETPAAEAGVLQAAVGDTFFSLRQEGTQVTLYRQLQATPAWECPFEGYLTMLRRFSSGQYVAFEDYNNYYLLDMGSRTITWSCPKTDGQLLGFAQDGGKLWYLEQGSLHALDTASLTVDSHLLDTSIAGDGAALQSSVLLSGDSFFCFLRSPMQFMLVQLDLSSRQVTTYGLPMEEGEDIATVRFELLASHGQQLWLFGSGGRVLELDLSTGSVCEVCRELPQKPFVAVREDGCIAITHEENVLLHTPGQDGVMTVSLNNAKAGRVCFYGNDLLVLGDNGFLYRFDVSGTLLAQLALEVGDTFAQDLFSSFADPSQISWNFGEDGLLLVVFGSGNVIDLESWALRSVVENCIARHEDTYLCTAQGSFRGIPAHSTEDLLELAAETLGDFRLTDEQLSAYGLG